MIYRFLPDLTRARAPHHPSVHGRHTGNGVILLRAAVERQILHRGKPSEPREKGENDMSCKRLAANDVFLLQTALANGAQDQGIAGNTSSVSALATHAKLYAMALS
jgi:hypothetical protein